jgi:NADPH:quinone reductase-like Zn-dependent oxidoreductase
MTVQSKQWIISNTTGIDDLKTQVIDTSPLGDFDVLVKMKALSLNHRDAVLVTVRTTRWLQIESHPEDRISPSF